MLVISEKCRESHLHLGLRCVILLSISFLRTCELINIVNQILGLNDNNPPIAAHAQLIKTAHENRFL